MCIDMYKKLYLQAGGTIRKNCDIVNCEQFTKGRVINSIRRIEKDLEKQK